MGAVFVDSFDSAGRESQGDSLFQFWDVNALFLEVWVFSNHPSRIKLGSTSSVGVTASHL